MGSHRQKYTAYETGDKGIGLSKKLTDTFTKIEIEYLGFFTKKGKTEILRKMVYQEYHGQDSATNINHHL